VTALKGFIRSSTVCSAIPYEMRQLADAPLCVLYPIEKQTMDFNIKVRVKFNAQKRARMGVWEAMEMLNKLVDESDPDASIRQFPSHCQCAHGIIILQTSVSQIEHLLQTAEAIRRDGKPDWMQVSIYLRAFTNASFILLLGHRSSA
jgi:hypothetical protein